MEWKFVMKIIGAVLVGGGCSGYGILKGRIFLEKSRQLRRLWELMDYGYSEIRYKVSTLEEVFEHMSKIAPKPYNEVFAAMIYKLHTQHQSLCDAWESGKHLLMENTLLLDRDLEAMQEFMQQSFIPEKRRQEELWQLAICRLQKKEKEYLEEYQSKERVYRNLGICIGCLCIILLF